MVDIKSGVLEQSFVCVYFKIILILKNVTQPLDIFNVPKSVLVTDPYNIISDNQCDDKTINNNLSKYDQHKQNIKYFEKMTLLFTNRPVARNVYQSFISMAGGRQLTTLEARQTIRKMHQK